MHLAMTQLDFTSKLIFSCELLIETLLIATSLGAILLCGYCYSVWPIAFAFTFRRCRS